MIKKHITRFLVRNGLVYLGPWKWSLPIHPFILLHSRGTSRSDTSEVPTSSDSEAGGGRGPGCCIWHAGSENGEAGNCPEVSLKIPNGFTLTNVKKHHLHLCFPTWQASPPTVTTSSIPSASCLWDAVLPERTVTELWKQGKYFLLWSKRDECRKYPNLTLN